MKQKQERYEPSADEIAAAEEMMTPEQAEATERRALFKLQERDAFNDFLDHQEANTERRQPTPQEKEAMDRSLETLGSIFAGSDVSWHLDGAINISVLKGEYIGVHKDVDIAVENDEAEKLDGALMKSGYGLFLSRFSETGGAPKKHVMERVGGAAFASAAPEHRMIAAIDKDGRLVQDKALNYVDIHAVERDAEGRPLGPNRIPLPEKWFQPIKISFRGAELNVSHPAKVAFYKIHQDRSYDMADLRKLAETGKMSGEDLDEIEKAVEAEMAAGSVTADGIIRKAFERIRPDSSAEDIFQAFVAALPPNKEITEESGAELRKITDQIAEEKDRSYGKVRELAFEAAGITGFEEKLRGRLRQLRGWVKDAAEAEKLRKEIGGK